MKIRDFFKTKYIVLGLYFLIDLNAVLISALLSIQIRFDSYTNADLEIAKQYNIDSKTILLVIGIGWISILFLNGAYSLNHSNIVNLNLRNIFRQSLTYFFALGFASFVFKASFSRSIFLVMFCSGVALIFIGRALLHFALRNFFRKGKFNTALLVIGKSQLELDKYADWIIDNRHLGFRVGRRIICEKIDIEWLKIFEHEVQKFEELEVLLLPGMETDINFVKFLLYLEDLGIHVNWIPLSSSSLGYWLTPARQEGSPFLTFTSSDIKPIQKIIKRVFDIAFSVSVILLIAPFLAIIASAILISDGRPVIYSQARIGQGGKVFKFFKFRSMVVNADDLLSEVSNMHDSRHILFKNAHDPRVTKLGRILRRYSLDELPQFINVLNNSMSVVGPRPALPREVNSYDSIYERRLIAKPGITGPWQISGRSDLDLQTSLSLDLNYLTNWSFTRDIWIVFSTIGAIFKGKGAY